MKLISLENLQRASASRPLGYLKDVLRQGVVKGDYLELSDEAYEFLRDKYSGKKTSGPGTELKKLLKTIGIEAAPGCKCNKRALEMDLKGCDWCEDNIDLISSWLQEAAADRSLPYVASAGKLLIRIAIRRARAGNNQQGE